MRILFLSSTHLIKSLNGAEVYHHNLAKELQRIGHEVNMCVDVIPEIVNHDGVLSFPLRHREQLLQQADIIIAKPGKINRPIHGKKIILMQHNCIREPFKIDFAHVVYCAHHAADVCRYDCIDSYVFWPFNRYAGCTPLPANPDGYVTLVNCNNNKGGQRLIDYAKEMPEVHFLGVLSGYGHQITADAHNLTYKQGSEDLADVLKDTSILIMPSITEGLPTIALEAISLGVPVVGSNIAAFHEIGIRAKDRSRDNFPELIQQAIDNYHQLRAVQLELINEHERQRNIADFLKWITNFE